MDGEGHVAIHKKRTRFGNTKHRPVIVVSMTCETTVRSLRDICGVGTVRFRPKRHGHHQDQFWWAIVSRQAYSVAKLLVKYSVTKKERLVEIIDHYEQPLRSTINRPGQKGANNKGARLTDGDVWEIRQSGLSQRELATQFGVSQKTINNVKNYRTYV